MTPVKDAATRFLASERIAVTGVSRTPAGHGGNIVYNRLRDRGYQVFAVNPNAEEVEGDPCYRDLGSIPDGVDAVVIATAPDAATELGRQHDVTVIDGGCPLMFQPTSDGPHRFLKLVCTWTGKAPRTV